VIVIRIVHLSDPLARANVLDALSGDGAPQGVLDVVDDGTSLTVRFDSDVTPSELIDDLVAIESVFVPALGPADLTLDAAAAIAAAGLGDPDLDADRIIETQLGARR
jgi:hypothetical protein